MNQFVQNRVTAGALVVSVLALTGMIAMGVFTYQQERKTEQRLADLEADVHIKTTELGIETDWNRRQLEELRATANNVVTSSDETASTCEKREFATMNQRDLLDAGGALNTDPATTTVTYTNRPKGLSIELPYNENWGTSCYKLPPYEEFTSNSKPTVNQDQVNYVMFGYMAGAEGGIDRYYALDFVGASTTKEIMARPGLDQPQSKKIGTLDVVEYGEGEMGGSWTLEIRGKKFNYRLQKFAGDQNETFAELEKIAKTIRFLP